MSSRTVGLVLLVGALVALLMLPDRLGAPAALYGFLALFVPGVLLATGAIGTSLRVEEARRHPDEVRRGERRPVTDTISFGYPDPSSAAAGLLTIAPLLLVGAAVVLTATMGGTLQSRLAVALPLGGGGLLLWFYPTYRFRTKIVVGPAGIGVQTPIGKKLLPWDDIVALSAKRVALGGGQGGGLPGGGVPGGGLPGGGVQGVGVYRVYTPTAVISFQASLEDSETLAHLVAGATGLPWLSE